MAKSAVQRLSALSIVKAGRVEFMVLRGGVGMEFYDFAKYIDLQSADLSNVWEIFNGAVKARWEILSLAVEGWRKTLDPAIWLTGSVLALVPGTFAIYKWWNYRNSRLPLRLDEMLKKDEARLRDEARLALLQAVKHPNAARVSVVPPLFAVPTLKSTIRNLNWSGWLNPFPFDAAERELEFALVEIEERLLFCEKSRANSRRQEATAYIVKGAIAAVRASKNKASPENSDKDNRAALNHFIRALEIEPNDVEALEYVGHQQRVVGQDGPAVSTFERLIALTENMGGEAKLATARAYRSIGEILEKQYDSTNVQLRLTHARQRLESAFVALPTSANGQLDHAAIREIQGRLAKKDGAVQLPTTRYSEALSIYGSIKAKDPTSQDAVDGFDRVKKALQDFMLDGPQAPSAMN